MRYRQLKGLRVSEVGVGCYGLSGVYGAKDAGAFRRMLARAFELGVTLFDTAEGYGDAEQILGESIKPFRNEVIVATKVGIRESSKADLSATAVTQACEASLRRLQREWIDLYQVHFDDPETPVAETVEALERLQKRGLIRYYGLGHLPLQRVEAYAQQGNPTFMLLELSAVTTDARKHLLPFCREHDLAAIAFSTTGRGLLTGRYGRDAQFPATDIRHIDPLFRRERLDYGLRVAERVEEMGRRYGKTPAQTAIAWVLAQPGVVCALSGPSSIAHLEENVGGSGWTVARPDRAAFEAFLTEEGARLAGQQQGTMEAIARGLLPDDPTEAFADLLYALEAAIATGLVAEDEGMALVPALFAARDGSAEETGQALAEVQGRLAALMKDTAGAGPAV